MTPRTSTQQKAAEEAAQTSSAMPNKHERSELLRFAKTLPLWSRVRRDCEEIALTQAPIRIVEFDRIMKTYRAWLTFGEVPVEMKPSDEKAIYWKTARATISCARFKAGEFVSVQYQHTGINGIDWYLIDRTENGPISPVAYPAHHLTQFCI